MADLPINQIIQGDCLEVMKGWPDGCVDMCVTSPPYWGLRDYGVEGQLGLEKTPEEYVAKMVEVFREVRRALKDKGTLWLNLGDSYTSGGRGSGMQGEAGAKQRSNVGALLGPKSAPPGLKPKDLCGIPWRVAFALQADGWYLRQDIIWHKPNPMPESCTDRCTKAHEYLFLLSKKPRYWYDADAIREEVQASNTPTGRDNAAGIESKRAVERELLGKLSGGHAYKVAYCNPSGRNRRSVWIISTQSYSEAHFATFPEQLVEPCILAGCPREVCVKCGKGRERVVEKSGGTTGESWHDHTNDIGEGQSQGSHPGGVGAKEAKEGNPYTVKAIGWTDCGCGAGFEPGVALDPFGGSGTVGQVAARLDRNYVLIELNAEYIKLAEKRISVGETGISVKERDNGQLPMFP